MVLITFKGFS